MGYEYKNSMEEYINAEDDKYYFQPKKVIGDIIIPAFVYPIIAIMAIIYCLEDNQNLLAAVFVGLIVFVEYTVFVVMPKTRRKKIREGYNNFFEEHKYIKDNKVFELKDNKIYLTFSNNKEVSRSISEIKKVKEKNDAINIYVENYDILTVIPYSVFKTDEEKNNLINLISNKK